MKALVGIWSSRSSRCPVRRRRRSAVDRDVQVGSLTLKRCDVAARALCGAIRRNWERGPARGGHGPRQVRARSRRRTRAGRRWAPWCRTRAGRDTARPGPSARSCACTAGCSSGTRCCSSTSVAPAAPSRSTARRSRTCGSTTTSPPVGAAAASAPARTTTRPRWRPTTPPSSREALELGPLDLYGDSYGTFFQQVFAGRHPDLVRSIVLDGAYPTYGETGWYPTQGPAMRNAFQKVDSGWQSGDRQGPRPGPGAPVARRLPRRRRPARAGDRGREDAGGRGVRCDVRAGVLPRDDGGAALRAARRPRADLAAGRRSARRWHRRRQPARLQRGTRRRRRLPRLPAGLRHDREPARARGAVRRRAGLAEPVAPAHVCAVHGPRVRRLRLADAQLVPALAGGARVQPGPAGPHRRAGRTPTYPCWC